MTTRMRWTKIDFEVSGVCVRREGQALFFCLSVIPNVFVSHSSSNSTHTYHGCKLLSNIEEPEPSKLQKIHPRLVGSQHDRATAVDLLAWCIVGDQEESILVSVDIQQRERKDLLRKIENDESRFRSPCSRKGLWG